VVSRVDIQTVLNKMILSASGWRGIFASCGDEESNSEQILDIHRIISATAALVFAEYLIKIYPEQKITILIGTDTRPTGKKIAAAMIPVLSSCGCEVCYAGIVAAPEIMAWAKCKEEDAAGFIYISASHNPVGHNGIKFGLTDGGVLSAGETSKLIKSFRNFFNSTHLYEKIDTLVSIAEEDRIKRIYNNIEKMKAQAIEAYNDFSGTVAWDSNDEIFYAVKEGLAKQPLGIVCDFNGSARTISVDKKYFSSLGLKFDCINSEPGQIAHRIVPEGESLNPCIILLEEAHSRDASFMLGYVPDCDGDRGNLVIWDDKQKKARSLEAQEVFALACVAEFSHLVRTGMLKYDGNGNVLTKAAIAVNDPTSMRIDRIAEAFGISVFRAEVGEANVVGLARVLREKGYVVRILGEGSAGGNITHPSAVRDPLNTVLAIVKLLSIRSSTDQNDCAINSGLFEIWCTRSGQKAKYINDFTLADVIASLPQFTTTPAYSDDAVMRIKTKEHSVLKECYQKVFTREWEKRKDEMKAKYKFCGWEVIAYNGQEEKHGIARFKENGSGGLKICFLNEKGREIAYIWMRGSATEPVFRIMADVEGLDKSLEKELLEWHKSMIIESDKGSN
jgi:phosphoglucomutase